MNILKSFSFLFIVVLSFVAYSCNEEKSKQANSNYEETIIVDPIEPLPQFPGGEKELYCFLDYNLDKEKLGSVDTTGLTLAQFVIDTTGKVKDVRILKKLNPIIDNEFERVIKLMPKWEPIKRKGRSVSSRLNLPLRIPFENKLCTEE